MTGTARITHEATGDGGVYRLETPEGDAFLSYRRAGEGRIIADHTRVDPRQRGRGLAALLVERLVADARAEGATIVPVCSYVETWRRRHPKEADIFTT